MLTAPSSENTSYIAVDVMRYLQEGRLVWSDVIERDVGRVRFLADQHGVTVTECPSTYILTTQSHVESCREGRRRRRGREE